MRKVFLENLPKIERGLNKGSISWKDSVGEEVPFVYEDLQGVVEIIHYNRDLREITIRYLDREDSIYTSSFLKCALGNIVRKKTSSHLYNEGEVIENAKSGEIKIIKSLRVMRSRGQSDKAYEYQCLICGNIDIIKESELRRRGGCNACSGRKVLKGFNDISTTANWMVDILYNKEDGEKYTSRSDSKIDFKCPNCQIKISNKSIAKIYERGLSCPRCSDGFSYPEKFMSNVLTQLHIKFSTQKVFAWSKILDEKTKKQRHKRYDFYICSLNTIIEVHGIQHYEQSARGRSLKKEKENDKIKKELAIENNVENYITIDCRYSDRNWIKKNIISSSLSRLLKLDEVDWESAHKDSLNTLIKEVSILWNIYNEERPNSRVATVKRISEELKIGVSTVQKYLRIGEDIGWCNRKKTDSSL